MRTWLLAAGLAGATAVALGAVAAHAASPEDVHRLEVAARYLMWHALALLGVAWLATTTARRWATAAGCLFLAGIVLFCGSLALSVALSQDSVAMAAPAGGLSFIAGWLVLAVAGLRSRA